MAPLESLSTVYPILDVDFRIFCASHGISSVEDFLIHDLYMLAAYAEQQPSRERLKQGITQVFAIIDDLHQPWRNGMNLLEDGQRNKHALSTGCERIDSLIKGGLHEGHVTELVGPSSSGKTQLCLLAAATVAMHNGGVFYIDTGNSFSPKRIVHLVGKVEQKILQKAMSRILCKSLYDIFALLSELRQLESNLQSQVDEGDNHVRLMVIDSISSLITPILGGSGPQGRALITSTGSLLKKLAHEYNIAILVTNHTVAGLGGTSKPALGETWKTIPHVRLLLSRDCGSNSSCNISILNHPSVASSKAAKFTIHD